MSQTEQDPVPSILHYPNPVLTTPCVPVETGEDLEFVASMNKIMEQRGALGVAANQIGVAKRLFVSKPIPIAVNPIIQRHGKEVVMHKEGCLSRPGYWFEAKRWRVIDVLYFEPSGKLHIETLKGLNAFIFQHELDHLNGIMCGGNPDGCRKIGDPGDTSGES